MRKDPFGTYGYINAVFFFYTRRIVVYDKEPQMHPTLSSTVHYFRYPGAEAQAAIVAHVNDDGTFNLAVFDHNGNPEPRPACVPFLGYGISIAAGHYCRDQYEGPEPMSLRTGDRLDGTGLQQGETSFANENTGFGGVFAPPVLTDVIDTPVQTEAMVGQGGTFDGAGASGDFDSSDYPKHVSSDLVNASIKSELAAAPSYDSSPSETQPSSFSSSDSSSSD